ncbi:MAG: glycosyltransferase [Candidatus Omnitrophica bacterium]|nr:glycosyltransferase [Candidatus Omnitrophota bacterium]
MSQTICALITTTEKNKKLLEQLVSSLCRQTELVQKVIIIYDGAQRPHRQTFEDCPIQINWINNRKKESLTYLQNQAVQFMKTDFVLQLNDDVVLKDNFIEELLMAINKDAAIGMACGKLLRMDKTTIDTAGQLLGKKRTPVERGYGRADIGQFEQECFVFGSCGAAVLLRKSMLEDCALSENEYFDKDYNMFYEDFDLSWRAANFGWKAFYTPKAVGFHARGTTAKEKEPIFEFLRAYNFAWLKSGLKSDLIKNRCMTIIKNDSFKDFILNLPHIFIYELKLFIYCLIFEPKVIGNIFFSLPLIFSAFKKRANLRKRIKAGKKKIMKECK